MPLHTILATRKVSYEFVIEANSEAEAIEEMERIDTTENAEDYAYDWALLEITDIQSQELEK
jgi:hypothetical protein